MLHQKVLTTSAQKITTLPLRGFFRAESALVANGTGGTVNVTVYAVKAGETPGAGNILIPSFEIENNQTLDVFSGVGSLVLENGDALYMLSDVAGPVATVPVLSL